MTAISPCWLVVFIVALPAYVVVASDDEHSLLLEKVVEIGYVYDDNRTFECYECIGSDASCGISCCDDVPLKRGCIACFVDITVIGRGSASKKTLHRHLLHFHKRQFTAKLINGWSTLSLLRSPKHGQRRLRCVQSTRSCIRFCSFSAGVLKHVKLWRV